MTHVVVACATSRPCSSTTRPSAVAVVRPTWIAVSVATKSTRPLEDAHKHLTVLLENSCPWVSATKRRGEFLITARGLIPDGG